jgi:trk system potassium uptake protein TrkA
MTHNTFPFRVVAIARGITTILPGGDHEILPQDQVLIMAARQDLPKLMALTGVKQQRRHRVMILGGGLVGCRVAELMGKDVRVKIVEKTKPGGRTVPPPDCTPRCFTGTAPMPKPSTWPG